MSRKLNKKAGPGKAVAARTASSAPSSGIRDWIFGLALVAAVIVAYQQVWHAGFIWDDDVYVTGNQLLSAPDGLRRIWFSFDSPSQYFPLTYTVLRLEYALWGLNPAGYHWVNLLLHSANAMLLWRLLRRLNLPGARLGAAIWALHPVQVESVAWITELKNVLMCFFFLLALLAWIGFLEGKPGRRWIFYALALAGYALALFSKTTACTLPAAMLLILWLKGRRINLPRLAEIIPFVALGIGMGLLTMWWERYHQGTQGQLFALGALKRILLASRAVWFYTGKLLWPVNLTFSYPRWTISASDPLAYSWLAATTGLGVAICYARRYAGRSLEVAALFFVSTLVPVSGIIMLYTFLYSFVADHYQYVADIGLIALASAGATVGLGLLGRKQAFLKPILPVFCGALLLTLGVLTWRQCEMYADIETLWRTTLARNPDSSMAHYNLGADLDQQGRLDEAISQFQAAIRLTPDYADAHNDLGAVLAQQGQLDEAIAQCREAIRLKPDFAEAYHNLGTALDQQGRLDEAITQYREAIRLKPDFAEACVNLGTALDRKGRPGEAIGQYQEAIRMKPDSAGIHYNLGTDLIKLGRLDEAISQLQEAIRLKSDYAEAHNNLGTALGMKGRLNEAISQYQEAIRLKPDYTEARNNLARELEIKNAPEGK